MNNFKSIPLQEISKFAKEKTIPKDVVLNALIELVDRVRQGDVISDLAAWDSLIEEMETSK
jgi:hypothetical protein